ncbi:hypothetical protein D3C86_1606140 [compost metagenome]
MAILRDRPLGISAVGGLELHGLFSRLEQPRHGPDLLEATRHGRIIDEEGLDLVLVRMRARHDDVAVRIALQIDRLMRVHAGPRERQRELPLEDRLFLAQLAPDGIPRDDTVGRVLEERAERAVLEGFRNPSAADLAPRLGESLLEARLCG